MPLVEFVHPDALHIDLRVDNHETIGVSNIKLRHAVNSSRSLKVQFADRSMAERCRLGAIVEFSYHRGIPNPSNFVGDKKFVGVIKSITPGDGFSTFVAYDFVTHLSKSQYVYYKKEDYIGEDLYFAAANAADYKGVDTSLLTQGSGLFITEDMDLFGWKTRKEFIDACFNEMKFIVNDSAHPSNSVKQWKYGIRGGKQLEFFLPDPESTQAVPAITASLDNNSIVSGELVSQIDTTRLINSITVASSTKETDYAQLEDANSIEQYGIHSHFLSYKTTDKNELHEVAYAILYRFNKPLFVYNLSLDNVDHLDIGDIVAIDLPTLEKDSTHEMVGYEIEFGENISTKIIIGQTKLTVKEYIDLLKKPTNR